MKANPLEKAEQLAEQLLAVIPEEQLEDVVGGLPAAEPINLDDVMP